MWHKEIREDPKKLCWSLVIPCHQLALCFSMRKVLSFPREYVGHILTNQRQSTKQNAGGPVPNLSLKMNCPIVSETCFLGKISQLQHLALFPSENKVGKSITKRSFWRGLCEQSSSYLHIHLTWIHQKSSYQESLPLFCHRQTRKVLFSLCYSDVALGEGKRSDTAEITVSSDPKPYVQLHKP